MLIKRILFYTLFLCYSCSPTYEPKKVDGIPLHAFWCGGSDGGNWYTIENIDSAAQKVHFKIYHDYTGELLQNKYFTLQCEAAMAINWNNLRKIISGFDGTSIHLVNVNKANKSCTFF